MKLKEYEGKELFAKHGITIPKGQVLISPKNVKLGKECVVKAQVLVGKRGKGGGIRFSDCSQVNAVCKKMLGSKVNGEKVNAVLVEEKLDITKELYVSITIDRFNQNYILVYSHSGGKDIEETARENPKAVKKINFIEFDKKKISAIIDDKKVVLVANKLWQIIKKENALLAEINPLVITGNGKYIAADSKIILDDNALNLKKMRKELNYVKLDGDIGIIGNGAGLVMATLDSVKEFGGKPACFLDLGGGTGADVVKKAIRKVLTNPKVRKLFINIFAGITKCDDIAKGIVRYKKQNKINIPISIRMGGTNAKLGKEILEKENFKVGTSMEEGVKVVCGL